MTMKQDGNVNQSYIDLIVEAWHELQEIEAGHAARVDGWHLKWSARSIRVGDREAMIRNLKKAKV